eukprot:2255911-Amphidinium_carterae.1
MLNNSNLGKPPLEEGARAFASCTALGHKPTHFVCNRSMSSSSSSSSESFNHRFTDDDQQHVAQASLVGTGLDAAQNVLLGPKL